MSFHRFRSSFCLAILFVVVLSCKGSAETVAVFFSNPDGQKSPVVNAELAVTNSTRRLGLMYRKELADTAGMLFVFPAEELRGFWMKNTYLELDIIFLDAARRVVSISHRAVPLTETKRKSTGPAKYVLEVRGGKAEEWGVVAGSELQVKGGRLPEAES